MRFERTTLEYRPLEGLFSISTFPKGKREPLVKTSTEFDLRFIGDQDINNVVDLAKVFPNHPHPVTRPRLVA